MGDVDTTNETSTIETSADTGTESTRPPIDSTVETEQVNTPDGSTEIEETKPTESTDASEDSPEPETESEEGEPKDDSPEWFMKDKYKTVEEQARAAFELQKKMGKFWGAPKDNYQVEGIEGIAKDDPLLENLMPALKDIGLSQEGFAHLVKQYQEANISMMKKFEDDLKQELTTNDAATYQACDKWMTDNLTAEEREQVQNNWLMTAADFKLFNHLRLMAAPSTNVPSSSAGEGARFESSKEVENDKIKYRREINQKIRVPDKNYEDELARRFRDARTRELRGK